MQHQNGHTQRSTIDLRYGAKRVTFQYDTERFSLLGSEKSALPALTDSDFDAVLRNPTDSLPLEEILRSGDKVLIVVPDATRAAGAARVVSLLKQRLNKIGLADKQISILIACGLHRSSTPAEIVSILGPDIPKALSVYVHDARDTAGMVYVGETSRGTPVEVNRKLVEADLVILVGAINFHYIAGFSGGRKAVLPGCASARSVLAHHLLAFDLDSLRQRDGVGTSILDGNPINENMEEAVAMIRPPFLVNTVLNESREIVALYAGHWQKAHRKGCQEYAATHSVNVHSRQPLMVVSCGGAPFDINMIQSHKAVDHASGVLEEGGTMIVLAECTQGLGPDDFLDWFGPGGARGTAMQLVQRYHVNGQTALSLRSKAERFRILLVSSLDAATVRKMDLEPHTSLESAFAAAGSSPGYIFPNGAVMLPRLD